MSRRLDIAGAGLSYCLDRRGAGDLARSLLAPSARHLATCQSYERWHESVQRQVCEIVGESAGRLILTIDTRQIGDGDELTRQRNRAFTRGQALVRFSHRIDAEVDNEDDELVFCPTC